MSNEAIPKPGMRRRNKIILGVVAVFVGLAVVGSFLPDRPTTGIGGNTAASATAAAPGVASSVAGASVGVAMTAVTDGSRQGVTAAASGVAAGFWPLVATATTRTSATRTTIPFV